MPLPLAARNEIREIQLLRTQARALESRWEIRQKKVTEPQLINELVRKRSKVACIGSFDKFESDPSTWWMIQKARSKNVTIVDVQYASKADLFTGDVFSRRKKAHSAMADKYLKSHGRQKERFGQLIKLMEFGRALHPGTGGLVSYRNSLTIPKMKELVYNRAFSRSPILMRRSVRLHLAHAWDTAIKHGSLDLVWNRGTWDWLADQEKLRDSIEHGLDLLRPGGRMAFLVRTKSDRSYPDLVREVERLFNKGKGNVHISEVRLEPPNRGLPSNYPVNGHYTYDRAMVVTKLK